MAGSSEQKTERMNLRIDTRSRALLEAASGEQHVSVSTFVLAAATREAEQVLADRHTFTLSRKDWEEFEAMLDRPARDVPGLREFLQAPQAFDNNGREGE